MDFHSRSPDSEALRSQDDASASTLDLTAIQGNVLRSYRFPVAWFGFAMIPSVASGRLWLAPLVNQVTDATDWGDARPPSTLNLAFTHQGLAAIGLAAESLDSFPDEFRAGMVANPDQLGDVGESAPEHWQDGLGLPDGVARTHVMASIYAESSQTLADRVASLRAGMIAAGLSVVHEQEAALLPGGVEHFGFRDGISEPSIQGSGDTGNPGDGVPSAGGTWSPLAAGEFILGHPAQDGSPRPVPTPAVEFGNNGTYVVYRKLKQDVALFRRYIAQSAARLRLDEEWLASRMIGRWRDGTPIEASPDGPDPILSSDPASINDFRFADDPLGKRCPVGAHIRRANPRDEFASGAAAVEGHRILRRGIAYGPPAPPGQDDDGVERGLVFLAMNASIRDQFAFIQRQWMISGDFPNLDPSHKDPIIGDNDGTGRMVIPMSGFPRFLVDLPRFISVRFGSYLFLPSLRGLRFLAMGES